MNEAGIINYLLLILGLLMGSFLNVVGLRFRYESGVLHFKNLNGRSHCPRCKSTLKWYELVPVVSFLIQRGRCKHCKNSISIQYPLVEIVSGLIFFYVPLVLLGSGNMFEIIHTAIWVLVFLTFIVLAVIDYRQYLIPNSLNIWLALLGIGDVVAKNAMGNFGTFEGSALGHYAALFGLRDNIWINHGAAALIGGVFLGLVFLITRGRAMGLGDVKLAFALGLLMGYPDGIVALMLAFIVGALVSGGLLLIRKKKIKEYVPFGPFIVLGATIVFFFGEKLLYLYFKIFPAF
ncbi:MAG: hypothetical protein A3F24_02990 [Candidatus Colwellbacteria bacterium RIFCSPHIGHO2_12_FULL_44_17]|uniref:Prepilin peptidase n=2 Tax=Candidatus Colwelliibacteriota TaxID=1817904 RepID=A0A1G1Z2R2_9BACT|nr:MAG: hypothetical protein A3F24_02990 [Candidatus Colwellbacteria bacterium RIFCSPHIGHO2_12_FULL_44_17]